MTSQTVKDPAVQAALDHAARVEREAAIVPDMPADTAFPPVGSVAVIGGGVMGSGIAMALADAGIPVMLREADPAALDKALARIAATYEVSVKRGSLGQAEREKRVALIGPAPDDAALAEADAVIEAVFESMDLKREVFARLDRVAKPGAILASNTSALDIDAIAAATGRPEAVIGAHFFSPANVMKLLEVVRGRATAKSTIAGTVALGRRMGKVVAVCGNCDGFLANRSRGPFIAEMNILIEEGATPRQIDRVMLEFGYRMGPFATADLAGHDNSHANRKRRKAADPGYRMLPIADRMVELGRRGQKAGAGWYRYADGDRRPQDDPETDRIIAEVRRERGIVPRVIGDDEVLRRMLFASVNEACRIIAEGIAARAGDVDAMWLNGFGFPRARGGLLYWADSVGGPKAVLGEIRRWHEALGERWSPAPLLIALAAHGSSFADAKPGLA
jgi:3-hydroxyacyl-CoA dehydrogenase